jgi:hypothetical protein
MAIVWGYVWPNWWQSGLQEELLDFIEDNTMPDLIVEDLLFFLESLLLNMRGLAPSISYQVRDRADSTVSSESTSMETRCRN